MTDPNQPEPSVALAEVATVYVTIAAAKRYASYARLRDLEEARRELTRMLTKAKLKGPAMEPGGLERWRYRSGRSGDSIDITAQVSQEGPLAIVVAVTARPYASKPRKRKPAS